MSVTFANVTGVKIPEGEVTKIQETSGQKRVLWEKKSTKDKTIFIEQYSSYDKKTYYSHYFSNPIDYPNRSGGGDIGFPNSSPFGMGNYWGLGNTDTINDIEWKLGVGSNFTLYSAKNYTAPAYNKDDWHEVIDAEWSVTPVHIWAATSSGEWGDKSRSFGPIEVNTPAITLSPTKGASVRLSSITNFNTFVSLFERDKISSSYPKSQYPNIRVEFALRASSPDLGLSMPDINLRRDYNSPLISFYASR